MFKFFKEKLKSWLGKSSESLKVKAKIEEGTEKKKKEKKKEDRLKREKAESKEKAKEEKELKQPVPKKTELELKEEREISSKILEDIKKEKGTEEIHGKLTLEEFPAKEIPEKEGKKSGIFARLKKIFSYKISESDFLEIFSNLEGVLLENNVALEAVEAIKKKLKTELINKEIKKDKLEEEIKFALKKAIEDILIEPDDFLQVVKFKKPFVIVFFGVNGTGKTTTVAKVAHLLLKNKISCVLAASDTFRAASIEQLQMHADKLKVKLIKHNYGADPAAVAFDAIKHARAHNIDVVLIDTAGRMHTKDNLLAEMEKICRVTQPDLKLFVAESIAGNDTIQQAKSFNELAGIDASILTKADVDEKGGTAISVSYATKKPILFLGIGQSYDDLEVFNREKFMKELGL